MRARGSCDVGVIVINPNSTEAMTDAMVAQARSAAPEQVFEGWTSRQGPPAIQGPEDGATATPHVLDLIRQAPAARGIIIGCFDDTGLQEAAGIAACPVIGIGQASYHSAALRQWRFSVVTTLSVSVPVLEQNVYALGLGQYLSRVRASEVPVLALEDDPEAASKAIVAQAKRAAAEDEIDAVVLGCAGMLHVVEAVRCELAIPVIDPVTAAAKAMSWLT